MTRVDEFVVGLLAIVLGGVGSLTGFAMTIGMLISPETKSEVLFWVAIVALAVAPAVFIAGIRLFLDRPCKHGGLFNAFTLRGLAIVNGVLGGAIIILAYQTSDILGIIGGASYLITTQAAFVLANERLAT